MNPIRCRATPAVALLLLAAVAAADDAKRKGALPSTIDTEFSVTRDGLPFSNEGDYLSPDGNCVGMSLLAVGRYLERVRNERDATPEPRIVSHPKDGDLRLAAAAAVLQEKNDVNEDDERDNPSFTQAKAARTIVPALRRIARTGVPEILGLYGEEYSHAAVLYGFRDGKLLIYDPSYQGEVIEWPFDEETGLGAHPKARHDPTVYSPTVKVSSTPYSRYVTTKHVMPVLRACDALAAACMRHFPLVTAKVAATDGEKVSISGRVTGGRKWKDGERVAPAKTVWLTINGEARATARIEKDGSYRLVVPAALLAREKNDIRVVATTDDGALAGFVEQKAARPRPPGETPGAAGALGRAR